VLLAFIVSLLVLLAAPILAQVVLVWISRVRAFANA
jgi:Zn-dependent protease with chaperone function